jgi:glutamate formiminotransferase/formiminotetrahydrofolate cyclodeaminase
VAFDVREAGRPKREGDPVTGKVVNDAAGQPVMVPGTLKAVKAIGWFIEEYGIAQVSMNLTDLSVTPLHIAFEEVCRKAEARGMRVTGSELVGLVPLSAMLEAGRYFLKKQQRSVGVPDHELMKIAIRSMGLDELAPFAPSERVLEYRLAKGSRDAVLTSLTVEGFADLTASESPAPGGGSVSALIGALGASLGAMVANLSAHKRGWEARWEEFSTWAERGQQLKVELLRLVDEDTKAFNAVLAAMGMPKGTPEEQEARREALATANGRAVEVPLEVMRRSFASFELLMAMAQQGNPVSASDAGVGAICARAAVRGAWLNVRTNLSGPSKPAGFETTLSEGRRIAADAEQKEKEILAVVEGKMGA